MRLFLAADAHKSALQLSISSSCPFVHAGFLHGRGAVMYSLFLPENSAADELGIEPEDRHFFLLIQLDGRAEDVYLSALHKCTVAESTGIKHQDFSAGAIIRQRVGII